MGMNTFNMFGTYNIQIPDYFETHYKKEDEDLSKYFIARYLPEDSDWENYENSEQGISVSTPINTEYEGVDFTDKQLQETILSKLKAIMDKSKESMLAATSGIMRAIMMKALETDCPYIYHAEKDYIVIIYTESQSCSTRSAFAFFNNCAACQITFRDNRGVDSDEKKTFSSSVLDSIRTEISASGLSGKTSANTQKKNTAKSRKKPTVCPIPQDFKDHTTITDKDFRPDSILAQSAVCYILEALSKIDLHFSSQKSDHEIGNDLFKDLINVASFQEYQGTVMQAIGNDHYIKPLMIYTIRDFFATIRQNGKADRDRIISSYSGLFVDILRFFYTNDRISDPEMLIRGMGTLGLRYRDVILNDVTAFSKKLKQTPEKRLLAGREWVTKICSQPDLHFLCSKDKINHLMLFKYLCDDVLHFQENDFEWDEETGKHKINGIQANGEVIWNYPELFFMWNDMPKLVVEYLRTKEESIFGISENDKNRKRPWDEIGAWTPFALFFAATQDKVTMSFSEDGHVYLCLTELLAPFENSLRKILSEKFYSISPEITVVFNRSEVISHNFQWGMEVQNIGFCSGQKLLEKTLIVLKEYKKEYKREIAYAWPSQKFSHRPSWGFVGMGGFMGSGGVSFKSFSSVDFDRDEDELYDFPSEQVMDKIDGLLENTSEFSEEQRALHYARLFRVSETVFDKWSDRENEIRNGYLKDSRMLTTFREFVWSLASYLSDQGKAFDAVATEDIHKILDMIEARENTNYAEDSYFPELCSVSDNFSIYTDVNDPDIRIAKAFTALSESENDTVNCLGNLSALRNEIRLLIPAMDLIYNELKSSRDPEQPLEGKPADILNAWCIIALAAKENVVSATTGRLGFVWDRFTDEDDFQDSRTPSEIIFGTKMPWMVCDQSDKEIFYENVSENNNNPIASDESFVIVGTALVKYLGKEKTVTVPDGITTISSRAFFKKNFITEINLPNSLEKIGDSAFNACEKLEYIIIPDSVKSIGNFAFGNCKSLVSVKFPYSLEYLGKNAFAECKKLEKAEIKGNITAIEEGTFKSCRSLKKVQMPDTVIKIGTMCFWWCFELEDIVLSNNLEKINNSAFDSCGKLKAINFPPSLRELDIHVFMRTGLESVKLLENTKKIGDGCFYECKNLKTAEILGFIKIVPERLFSGCPITNFKVPEGVQTIGKDAFKGGYNSETKTSFNLNTIYIPESVIKIDEEAFSSYSDLTIHCTKGSYAEQFALNHGCKIVTIQNDNSAIIQESQLGKNDVEDSSELEPTSNNKQSTIDNSFETINNTKGLSSILSQFSEPSIMEIDIFDWKSENEQDVRAISSEACKNGLDLTWLYFILRNEWTLGVLNTSGDEFWRMNQKYFPNIQYETLLLRRQQAMPWLNDPNTYNNQFRMLYGTSFDQRYTMLVRHFMDRINPSDPWQHINNAFSWLRNFFTPQEQQILWNRLCEEINNKKSYILEQLSGLDDDFTVFDTAKQYLILLLEAPAPEKLDRGNPYNYLTQEAFIRVGLYDSSRMDMFVPLITTQAWIWNTTLDEIYRSAVRNIQDLRPGKSDGKELIRRLLPQYFY